MRDMTEQTLADRLDWLRQQEPAVRRETLDRAADRGTDQDVALLTALLRDDHPAVRQSAVAGLMRVGSPTVVRELLGMLREPAAVRNTAIEVIEQLAPATLDLLLPAVDSPDAQVRKFLVEALSKTADVTAGPAVSALLADPDPNVRASAADAAGRLRTVDAVPGLTGLLHDEEWVAFSAVSALAEIGDPTALPALIALLEGSSVPLRYAAIEAIGMLDQDGRSCASLVDLAGRASVDLQPALIKALVAVADRAGQDIWQRLEVTSWFLVLTEALAHADTSVRLAAMRGLAQLRDPEGTRPVLSMLAATSLAEPEQDLAVLALADMGHVRELTLAASREDEHLSKLAIRALGILAAPEAVHALAAIRQTSSNWELRKLSLSALGAIGTPQAMQCLREALDDPTGYVRCEAVRLLATLGGPVEATALVERLKGERYDDVRDEIVRALSDRASGEVCGELIDLLTSQTPALRESAARALGLAQVPGGAEPLCQAVNDPEWRVRQAAVEALGRYGGETVFHVLVLALSDDHEKVRLAATTAVARQQTPEAVAALITQSRQDPDVWVRYRAIERLGALHTDEAVPSLAELARSTREPALLRRMAVGALTAIDTPLARTALSEMPRRQDIDLNPEVDDATDARRQPPGGRSEAGGCT